jgi:glycosyltransferase involved in cell wall biosynthesis
VNEPAVRILLGTKTMDVGGIERSVVAIARELRKRGHAVWVVSSGGYLVRELERDGTPHIFAPLGISPFGVARAAQTIRRLICECQVDLVHSFSATASMAVNLALRPRSRNGTAGARLVSSPMGLQNSPRELPITTWLRNWVLTLGAERIIAISPEIRRHLKQVGAREECLVDFSFVGLDVDRMGGATHDRASVCREFGFGDDVRIISTIGALHPRKSHELFVDAAALLAEEAPHARFLVVGDGDLRQELEQRARARGLHGRLIFTGVRDDVARLLSATDVYVKPGIVEGYIGVTVLEALALGTPVVAFDTQDVKLAITDGVTGVVVPNADTAALAEKILYLLRNPDVGSRLGEAGRKLVEARFHTSQLAQQLEQFYHRLLATSAPALAR